MKTIKFTLLFLVVILSTTKCNIIFPEKVIPEISINEVNVFPSSNVNYGDSVTIIWSCSGSTYCKFEDKTYKTKDSVRINFLTEPKYFTLYAYNDLGERKTYDINLSVKSAPAPELTVEYSGIIVPYGWATVFTWKTSGYVDQVKINENLVQNVDSGYIVTPALYDKTSYKIEALGPGGVTTKNISIPVGNWTTSDIGLITYGRFIADREIILNTKGDSVAHVILSRKYEISFNTDGSYDDWINGVYNSKGKWKFINNLTLSFNRGSYKVEELSQNNLVISTPFIKTYFKRK